MFADVHFSFECLRIAILSLRWKLFFPKVPQQTLHHGIHDLCFLWHSPHPPVPVWGLLMLWFWTSSPGSNLRRCKHHRRDPKRPALMRPRAGDTGSAPRTVSDLSFWIHLGRNLIENHEKVSLSLGLANKDLSGSCWFTFELFYVLFKDLTLSNCPVCLDHTTYLHHPLTSEEPEPSLSHSRLWPRILIWLRSHYRRTVSITLHYSFGIHSHNFVDYGWRIHIALVEKLK